MTDFTEFHDELRSVAGDLLAKANNVEWPSLVAAGWVGRAVAVGVVAWALIWPLTYGGRPDLWTVAWAALIGAFLWSGAGQAITVGRTREATMRAAGASKPMQGISKASMR